MMSKGEMIMTNNDPYTKETDSRFTLRIPSELLDKVREEAKRNKRSAGKQIEFILEQWYLNDSSK